MTKGGARSRCGRGPGRTTGPWRHAIAGIALTVVTLAGGCADEGGVDPVDEVGVGDGVDGPGEEVPLGGEDPTLADDGIDPGRGVAELVADLEITVGTDGNDELSRQAVLSCGDDGATGALWLDGDAAEAACVALADASTIAELDPPADDRACAEVDGGPEVATIVGTVDGVQVDAVVRRSDACGVERWDALAPLLPEPRDVGTPG